MVPGMDGTGRLFYQQVPRLAQRFRVATYALRDEATSMSTLVNDLAGVVHTLAPGGEPVTVVGESFGGLLSLSFALDRPELVKELVVLNSFPRFLPQFRLKLAIMGLYMMPWGAMRLVRYLTAFRMHSRYTRRREIKKFLAEMKGTTKRGYINRLRILIKTDVREQLHNIKAPTLFLAADQDHLVPSVKQGEYMTARVPGSKLRILNGHGHVCLIAPDLDLAQIITYSQPS